MAHLEVDILRTSETGRKTWVRLVATPKADNQSLEWAKAQGLHHALTHQDHVRVRKVKTLALFSPEGPQTIPEAQEESEAGRLRAELVSLQVNHDETLNQILGMAPPCWDGDAAVEHLAITFVDSLVNRTTTRQGHRDECTCDA